MFRNSVESTLSNIRLYYWIIRGRSFVNRIFRNCYLCKLVLGKPVMPPLTPSYPNYRLRCMFPFQTIGFEYIVQYMLGSSTQAVTIYLNVIFY